MVSHDLKCIFIHIPKTAGTSIEKKLGHFTELRDGVQDHRSIRELEPFAATHLPALFRRRDPFPLKKIRNRLQGLPTPTADQYRTYFKFTIVRNTWARVFSWYRNVMNNPAHQRERGITRELTLKEFLLDHPDDWGLRSQLYWLRDSRGDLPLDFVGRFENLADDFATICERLGVADCTLPRLIVGDGRKYVDHFDRETIDIVARAYREEIAEFGFEFGQ